MGFFIFILFSLLSAHFLIEAEAGPCEEIMSCIELVKDTETIKTAIPMFLDDSSLCRYGNSDDIRNCLGRIRMSECDNEQTRRTGLLVQTIVAVYCIPGVSNSFGKSLCSYLGTERSVFQGDKLSRCKDDFKRMSLSLTQPAASFRKCSLVRDMAYCIERAAEGSCGRPFYMFYAKMWQAVNHLEDCDKGWELIGAIMDRIPG